MFIRKVKPKDYKVIYNFIADQFSSAYHSNGDEHLNVKDIVNSEYYLPELTFVIEERRSIIGFLTISKAKQEEIGNETDRKVLSLRCVCIKKEYRNSNLGTQLINFAIKKASKLKYDAIMLSGDIEYYSKFGFTSASRFDLCNNDDSKNVEDNEVIALELQDANYNYNNSKIAKVGC